MFRIYQLDLILCLKYVVCLSRSIIVNQYSNQSVNKSELIDNQLISQVILT